MSKTEPPEENNYTPDKRLKKIYLEASLLDNDGLESLCPSYSELKNDSPRYKQDKVIGEGALKIIFRAFDRKTQRWIALAHLQPGLDEEYYDHFVHEAWLVSALSHPNIIKVFDTGIAEDGRPFFTMDLKGESTLADLVKSEPTPSLRDLLQVFVKVCDAISYAHSMQRVHLDLKPENIQSDVFGEVMVCDWGLGKVLHSDNYKYDTIYYNNCNHDNMTLLNQVKGSLGYMAPEQAQPNGEKDTRTDIYSLGCILYFILSGEAPFQGNQKSILEKTAKSEFRSLRTAFPNKNIPESLDAVAKKAMSLKASDRYKSVPLLQAEIERYLSGYATQAEEPGFFREALLFLNRNFIPTIISAVALLSIGVLSTIYAQHLSHQKNATNLERNRANQLSKAVSDLDNEYTSFVDQSEASKKILAINMAASARHVRRITIFERPIDAIKSSRNMATRALEQDSSCTEAHAELFAIDCLQLNYRSALASPIIANTSEIDTVYIQFIRLAKAFPDFDYARRKRPSINEFVSYIHKARTLNSSLHGHLERIIAYDWATRENKTDYSQIIEAFLQYRHGGPENLSLNLDIANSSLTIKSNRSISLLGQENHWNCLLRFLTFRFLKLETKGKFRLADLNDQPIENLDLSECEEIQLKKTIRLPQLRHLIIRKGQFEIGTLATLISSHENFKITEK